MVRAFSFQKVPNCEWHGPRSHINRVGPIKTADQVPAEIVQIGIEDGGNLRPLFVVAKNLAVANYSDNLAGLRIDNIALEHVFLFCVSDVTFTTPNSPRCSAFGQHLRQAEQAHRLPVKIETGALFPSPGETLVRPRVCPLGAGLRVALAVRLLCSRASI